MSVSELDWQPREFVRSRITSAITCNFNLKNSEKFEITCHWQ